MSKYSSILRLLWLPFVVSILLEFVFLGIMGVMSELGVGIIQVLVGEFYRLLLLLLVSAGGLTLLPALPGICVSLLGNKLWPDKAPMINRLLLIVSLIFVCSATILTMYGFMAPVAYGCVRTGKTAEAIRLCDVCTPGWAPKYVTLPWFAIVAQELRYDDGVGAYYRTRALNMAKDAFGTNSPEYRGVEHDINGPPTKIELEQFAKHVVLHLSDLNSKSFVDSQRALAFNGAGMNELDEPVISLLQKQDVISVNLAAANQGAQQLEQEKSVFTIKFNYVKVGEPNGQGMIPIEVGAQGVCQSTKVTRTEAPLNFRLLVGLQGPKDGDVRSFGLVVTSLENLSVGQSKGLKGR